MNKIPEQYCVKRNKETFGTINFYFNSLRYGLKFTDDGTVNFGDKSRDCDYLHYPKIGSKCRFNHIQKGYEEIPFEFFLKHIVNKEPINDIVENFQIY